MVLGQWLEMRAISQARGALSALAAILPDTAERVGGTEIRPESKSLQDRLPCQVSCCWGTNTRATAVQATYGVAGNSVSSTCRAMASTSMGPLLLPRQVGPCLDIHAVHRHCVHSAARTRSLPVDLYRTSRQRAHSRSCCGDHSGATARKRRRRNINSATLGRWSPECASDAQIFSLRQT